MGKKDRETPEPPKVLGQRGAPVELVPDLWVHFKDADLHVEKHIRTSLGTDCAAVYRCTCGKVFGRSECTGAAQCWLSHARRGVDMTLKKVRPRWALMAGGGQLLQPGEACDNCHSTLGGWVCGGHLCHIGKCSHARMFQQGRAFTDMRNFAGAGVYCKHPRSKNYLAEQGALLRGIANHLNAHRQIEIHLRKGMQKAHRLQKKRMIRQRLMVTPPDVDCADARFSARVRAFAAALSKFQFLY